MLMASPFWLAAVASQDLGAVTYNATDMASLRTAINNANAGTTDDIINVAAGTYTLTGAAQENANATGDFDITKATGNLQIIGAGAGTTIIDGATLDRVFHINVPSGRTVTIQHLTIQNGRTQDNGNLADEARGGAILVQQGNLTLSNVRLTNNAAVGVDGPAGTFGTPASATGGGSVATGGPGGSGGGGRPARGGALHFATGTLQINFCTFENNSVTGGDGGVGGAGGAADGNFSAIGGGGGTGGSGGAAEGAAIYITNGTVTLAGSTLTGGDATGGDAANGGPGGTAGGTASLAGANSWLDCFGGTGGTGGTGGPASGGGLFVMAGTVTLTNSTITGNSVTAGDGADGGVGGDATGISSINFVNNYGGTGGNGGNSGAPRGGGVYVGGGSVTINNCTIADGSCTEGTGGTVASGGNPGGPSGTTAGVSVPSAGGGLFRNAGTLTVNSTIFANSTASSGPDVSGNLTAGACLFETAPAGTVTPGTGANIVGTDPGLSALAYNGGPTQTRAISGGSAAANAGSNPSAQANDQRGPGFARAVGVTDIGAFEVQAGASPSSTPLITNPTSAVAVNAATFPIRGIASPNALVRVYSDINNNGIVDGTDAVVGQQQLTGGATGFNINVTLTQDAANNFTVTADDPVNNESVPADLPTITEDSSPPAAPVVTNPSAPVSYAGTTYNIQGTAEANSLVRVYSDNNDNGLVDGLDAEVASGTATGGNFSISTPLTLSTTNNFTVTATDAGNNQSAPTDVPTITEITTFTPPPMITTPSSSVAVDLPFFDVRGTAFPDSLVRVYSDANNDGMINGADAMVAQQQLAGGATNFSIPVPLTQNVANYFTATAEGGGSSESSPVNVPTITDNNGPASVKGRGGEGDCSISDGPGFGWLGLVAAFTAMVAGLRKLARRERA